MGTARAGKTAANGKSLPERAKQAPERRPVVLTPTVLRSAWTSGVAAGNLKGAGAKSFAKSRTIVMGAIASKSAVPENHDGRP